MAYENDSYLVISNKYGTASSDAKAMLFETYDQLRDIALDGSGLSACGFGTFSNWLINIARYIAPGAFMPVLDTQYLNVPGTSYYSSSGGATANYGSSSAFGYGSLNKYTAFPTGGAASIGALSGYGSITGITGGAASLSSLDSSSSITGYAANYGNLTTGGAASMVTASQPVGAAVGTLSGLGYGSSWLLPSAGVIAGIGSLAQALSPYAGPFGIAANVFGNITQGYGGAVLGAYQNATNRILNNADIVLTNKVKNLETVAKMLDAQSDIIKQMLKNQVEGDGKLAQELS